MPAAAHGTQQAARQACTLLCAWTPLLRRPLSPARHLLPGPTPQGEAASLWDAPAASEAAFGLAAAAAPTGEAAAVILVKLVIDM